MPINLKKDILAVIPEKSRLNYRSIELRNLSYGSQSEQGIVAEEVRI